MKIAIAMKTLETMTMMGMRMRMSRFKIVPKDHFSVLRRIAPMWVSIKNKEV